MPSKKSLTNPQNNYLMLCSKVKLPGLSRVKLITVTLTHAFQPRSGTSVLFPKLQFRKTGSWSFGFAVPKLELGNQKDFIR